MSDLPPLAPIEVAIAKLSLRPEDVLVLKYGAPLHAGIIEQWTRALGELRGDGGKVLVLDELSELSVIQKDPSRDQSPEGGKQ